MSVFTAYPLRRWDVLKVLHIPPTADFMDYSEMSVKAGSNKMAITSQVCRGQGLVTHQLSFTYNSTQYTYINIHTSVPNTHMQSTIHMHA